MPRETMGSSVICGPVLHLWRDDSEACASVLEPPVVVTAGAMTASALAFVAAGFVVQAQRRRIESDGGSPKPLES